MKNVRNLKGLLIIQVILIPAFIISAFAQQAGSNRRSSETRRIINNDTFRELMKAERENANASAASSDPGRAAILKQLRDDFRSLQDVNNRMMAEVWARQKLDYGRVSDMLSEINGKATRLKNNLSLPAPATSKTKQQALITSGAKEFKSALLLMDRSIMSFVRNPIFQKPNVVDVSLAAQASQDLENVIALSENLRKISANLKNSASDR